MFSSIVILIYSLIKEKNNYSNLSEKFYSCAAKIGKLKQEIQPHRTNSNLTNNELKKIYNNYTSKYYKILNLYETHSTNDFKADYKIAKLQMTDLDKLTKFQHFQYRIEIAFSYGINFIDYAIVFIIYFYIIDWIL